MLDCTNTRYRGNVHLHLIRTTARVADSAVRKSKKKVDTGNEEPLHPIIRISHINKDAVPTWARDITPWPERSRADYFSVHSAGTRWVTWGTECGCG
jgi:hypothetical protein